MPYGTDSFTDGYGDFKQPTVIDYDKIFNNTVGCSPCLLSDKEIAENEIKFKKDQEDILKEILETNPYYGGIRYKDLVFVSNSKLAWDAAKIDSLKSDIDWLYSLHRFLKKKKQSLITT